MLGQSAIPNCKRPLSHLYRRHHYAAIAVVLIALLTLTAASRNQATADAVHELRLGRAGHAFDHLGGISQQAEAAAASGMTIIYATGVGADGYLGLPAADKLAAEKQASSEYIRQAKKQGIRLAVGYLCATSIVKLETFDQNWSPEFRAQFRTPPAEWRQQGRDGELLPSWYGGDYRPACMNNPDWRAYEKFMVRQQIESGHDGIFFDNPTVHPNGCYCPHCMRRFGEFIRVRGKPTEELRRLADERKEDFLRFRCTIARDFLAEMRRYARSVKRDALITCNNSLNSPGVFFSQCRSYGYNIHELSKAEDFVVVEDMTSQPRTLANGRAVEYGPTYELLHAIRHGKPLVAVTIADADYHTPPNLMRLAMAEAAAHNASYLSWPTWPEEKRDGMIRAVRPMADFLRANESLLDGARPGRDAMLFLPLRQWLKTDKCKAADLAAELTRNNIQFEAICEDDLKLSRLCPAGTPTSTLVLESRSVLTESERKVLAAFERAGGRVLPLDETPYLLEYFSPGNKPSVVLRGPVQRVRAVVRDQKGRTILHLLNLNIQRISSFEDRVEPVFNLSVSCRVPMKEFRSVRILTADENGSREVKWTQHVDDGETVVEFRLPRLEIASIVVIE